MRTKALEKKRYSLRNVERKDFRSEQEVLAAVRKESKKAYEELYPSPLWNEVKVVEKFETIAPTGSTKRKRSKPEKTLNKKVEENIIVQDNFAGKSILGGETQQIAQASQNASMSMPPYGHSNESETIDDTPVYHALGHAIVCKAGPDQDCPVPKCRIAKQFLSHFYTCIRRNASCTICKAMDIMVDKHAQVCEVPLEKCCPIPECDNVRLRVLEEWVKLKHKHNEMMDRVFRGLIHAKKCNERKCDLVMCRNIKSAILHTRKCVQSDTCKTRKFVEHLCKHHQYMCSMSNEFCEVEFCKKRGAEHQSHLFQGQQQQQFPSIGSMLQPHNLMIPPTGGQNVALPGPIMCASPWGTNLIPISANTSQYFYPNAAMSYPSLAFDPNAPNPQQVYTPNITEQYDGQLEATTSNNVSDASISYPIPGDEQEQTIDEFSDTEQVDLYQVSTPTQAEDKKSQHDILSYTSPTQEMYYHLWSEKDDCSKNALPSLSPDDLKILSRGDERQILSPVTDNRASYSEVQPHQTNEYVLPESQEAEEETEEDPLPQSCAKPNMKEGGEKAVTYFQKANTPRRTMLHRIEGQSEWSKIDFVKQKMMEEGDMETETADESESGLVNNSDHFFHALPVVDDEKPAAHVKSKVDGSLTPIERSYMNITKDQK